jgi:uncharacterized protein YkwD
MRRARHLLTLVLGLCLAWACRAAAEEKKEELKLSKEEQEILDLTNKAREKEKLKPLKPNLILFQVARAHSANMAKQRKMAHKLDGKQVDQRTDDAGYDWALCAENVAGSEELMPKFIFDEWMKSKVHRVNIVKDKFEEIGIGIAKDAKGEYYYTQVFGTLRKK